MPERDEPDHGTGRVKTFEILEDGTRFHGTAESLAAASTLLPEGVYTSLRTYEHHRVLRLGDHMRRLVESLAFQGRPAPLDAHRVRRGVAAALRATCFPESRFRLTYAPPQLFISVEAYQPLPASTYRDGVRCATLFLRRENPHSKDTRFVPAAARAHGELPQGVEEGLMVAEDGRLLEGLSSNFFAVRQGALWTEESQALRGVTRAIVLDLARGVLPVRLVAARLDQLAELKECFITSVSREILPVVGIDAAVIADGRPGDVTRDLMRRCRELAQREIESVLS